MLPSPLPRLPIVFSFHQLSRVNSERLRQFADGRHMWFCLIALDADYSGGGDSRLLCELGLGKGSQSTQPLKVVAYVNHCFHRTRLFLASVVSLRLRPILYYKYIYRLLKLYEKYIKAARIREPEKELASARLPPPEARP